MGEAAPNISDIDKNAELSTEISTSIKNMVRNYKSRSNLHRKTIIRTLLRHIRSDYPQYNVVISEPGQLYATNFVDKILEEQYKMQDLIFKFRFQILVFKKAKISVLHHIKKGKKWG